MRTSKPITVTLGKQQPLVDARLKSGDYESASEIVRAGLRALEREEVALNEIMRRKIKASIEDPHPDIAASDVFARLRAHHDFVIGVDERDA